MINILCFQVYRAAKKVREDVGNVSILVNNAGVLSGKRIWESSDASIEKTFQVNTLAHFWVKFIALFNTNVYVLTALLCLFVQTVKAFLPWMMENNYGYIVQICSICAFVSSSGLTDYCASKSAAVTFAETLRTELKVANKDGISVTCVCPSHIGNTGMFTGLRVKFPRLFPSLKVEEVAERTLRATVEKQFMVAIPRNFNMFLFLKG